VTSEQDDAETRGRGDAGRNVSHSGVRDLRTRGLNPPLNLLIQWLQFSWGYNPHLNCLRVSPSGRLRISFLKQSTGHCLT